MKNFCLVAGFFLLSGFLLGQDEFGLYLDKSSKPSSGFFLGNTLSFIDQIYEIEYYVDSTEVENSYLRFVLFEEHTDVYFTEEYEGSFQTKIWKNRTHIIVYFLETNTYYFFHRRYPWMEKNQ